MIKGAREGRLHGIKGFVEIKGGLQCHAEKWETYWFAEIKKGLQRHPEHV